LKLKIGRYALCTAAPRGWTKIFISIQNYFSSRKILIPEQKLFIPAQLQLQQEIALENQSWQHAIIVEAIVRPGLLRFEKNAQLTVTVEIPITSNGHLVFFFFFCGNFTRRAMQHGKNLPGQVVV